MPGKVFLFMEAKEEGVLVGKVDVYNGVIVDAEKLPSDLVVFGESLQSKYCLFKLASQ